MTDYDLGKARGRIVIDHDDRGFRKAEGANDKLAESAHRVAEGYVDADKAQKAYDEQVKRTQKSEESLRVKHVESQKALNRLNEAHALSNRLKDEGRTNTERYKSAVEALTKAKNRYSEAVAEEARAETRRNNEVAKVQQSYKDLQHAIDHGNNRKVDVDTSSAMTKLKNLRKEHELLLRSLSTSSSVFMKVGGYGSGGLALGGLAGLAAGGATGYGVNGIMATIQAIGQLSGIAGLMPVVLGNLGATIGTTVIAFQGMGDAMSAVASNDAEKFAEALKKLSTNGQEVAFAFNEIYPALEDIQKATQNDFFAGIAAEMKALSQAYLPEIKAALGGFAEILNGTMKDLSGWAQQTSVMEDFKTIMGNLKDTMSALAPSARMLADIFTDIMKVSSDFGPSLAQSFTDMIREFRDFIDTARADGSLAKWVQTGIDSFKSLMGSLKQFGQAFGTIFQIQNQYSGGFFGFIERMATAFNEWTKSAEGNAALNNFFRSITEMSKALTPVLGSLANIVLGQIIPMFADLGTALQPGILSFLDSFSQALNILAPYLQQLSGPMNDLLKALGESLVQVIQQVGPALPGLFKAFADAIIALLPHLPEITKAIVVLAQDIGQHLPRIADFIGKVLPWVIQFADVVIGLAGALASAGIEIINWLTSLGDGFGQFLTNLLQVWPQQAGDALRGMWGILGTQLSALKDKVWEWMKELPAKAFDAGKAIVEDLMRGIVEKLGPLGRVAKDIVDTISDYLPHSPAKKGPFSGQGWSKNRGQKLATDFAEGITQGSNEAQYAGGTLAKSTEKGIGAFVTNMSEFSRFGQDIVQLFSSIADNLFTIAKIATTNPLTGKSILPEPQKNWKVTATPDELRRAKEDKVFKDQLDAQQKADAEQLKKNAQLRPDNISPSPANAIPLPNDGSIRGGAYPGDKALLANIPATGNKYEQTSNADLTKGLADCSSSVEDLVNILDGKPTGGRSMSTANAAEWLKARGFAPGLQEGAFNVGFNSGHMQATLPGGTNFNWGSQSAAAARGQDGGMGAYDPALTQKWHRPVNTAAAAATPPRIAPGASGMSNVMQNEPGYKTLDYTNTTRERQSRNGTKPDLFLVHTSEGLDGQKLVDFMKQKGDRSYNYVIDQNGKTVRNLVDPRQASWSVLDANNRSINAVIGGSHADWSRQQWIDNAGNAIKTMAQIAARDAAAFGIPTQIIRPGGGGTSGVSGHDYVTNQLGIGTHTDPGAYFPWDLLQSYMDAYSGQPQQNFGPRAPVPAPPPTPLGQTFSDNKSINRMTDPNQHRGTGTAPGDTPADPTNQFTQMNDTLDSIDQATQDQLSQQDLMINELRATNPALDQAIKIAQDPNSTDTQVGNALDQISQVAEDQRHMDNAQSRYIAQGLDSMASAAAGTRGMSQVAQVDPMQVAQQIVGGAFGIIGDGFKLFDASLKSIKSASEISSTLVRGISNTEDLYKIVDELQSFVELAGAITQTVSDGLALAGTIAMAAGGGQDAGATGAILQALSAVFGVATSVIQTINAAIDLGQEAYRLASKYVGQALSFLVGGGNGSLMGDIKFLLDQNSGLLKTWSGDNPNDKRVFAIPQAMQFSQTPEQQVGKIRDLNMYIGPGTDPNQAMNAAMWSIKTDQNGVFTGSAY